MSMPSKAAAMVSAADVDPFDETTVSRGSPSHSLEPLDSSLPSAGGPFLSGSSSASGGGLTSIGSAASSKRSGRKSFTAALDALLPPSAPELRSEGLPSTAPIASVILAATDPEISALIAGHPGTDFYVPARFADQIHLLAPGAPGRIFLLAR